MTDVPFVFVGIGGSVKLLDGSSRRRRAIHSAGTADTGSSASICERGQDRASDRGQGSQFGVPLGRRRRVKHTASVIHIKHQRAIHTEPVILIHHVTADKITHLQHQLLKHLNPDELSSELITDTN